MVDDNPNYECHKCDMPFKYKSDYERHLKRKIPCSNEEKIEQLKHKKTCKHCNKVFSRSDCVLRHLEKCTIKIQKDKESEKETILMKMLKEMQEKDIERQKEMQEMKQKIAQLETRPLTNNSINSNNNNIQNNINNDIKIIAYGKEDMSYITNDEYELLINKGFKSIPYFVEYVHFNKNKPENHNIYISNMRDNYLLVYDGEKWQIREREDVLQDMIDNKTDILNEKFDELIDKFDEITIKRFKKFLDEKDDDKVSAQLKKDLKMILYNKKLVTEVKPRYFGTVKKPVITNTSNISVTESKTDLEPKSILASIDDEISSE